MKSTTKVLLDEKDVLKAIGDFARDNYPHISGRALTIQVEIKRGVYSATVETDKAE